jgi:hypothetical protein
MQRQKSWTTLTKARSPGCVPTPAYNYNLQLLTRHIALAGHLKGKNKEQRTGAQKNGKQQAAHADKTIGGA